MILNTCAACAAPLENKWFRCGICKTRYCGQDCQKLHWKKGGHKALCQQIKSGGGAEQYHADKKYKEAVAVAVKKCAADTKGQTCYICTEALHWKTKEGLVRGCSCRGTAGFAHVSCLMEQAKILVAEAEENNLGAKVLEKIFERWNTCGLCKQALPRRREVRARVGVLEDVRGAAGGERGSARRDDAAWERFIRGKSVRGRVVRARGRVVYAAALGDQKK